MPALAQRQDATMLQRVTAVPDPQLVNPMQQKKFEGAPGLRLQKARGWERAMSAAPYEARRLRPMRSFFGIRNPWLGQTVYPAAQAAIPQRGSPPAGSRPPLLRAEPVRAYPEAGQARHEAARQVAGKPFLGRGGAQGALDLISEAARRELTAEELRQLLNKPR